MVAKNVKPQVFCPKRGFLVNHFEILSVGFPAACFLWSPLPLRGQNRPPECPWAAANWKQSTRIDSIRKCGQAGANLIILWNEWLFKKKKRKERKKSECTTEPWEPCGSKDPVTCCQVSEPFFKHVAPSCFFRECSHIHYHILISPKSG